MGVCWMNANSLTIPAFILFARFAVFSCAAEDRFFVYPRILQERATGTNVILHLTDAITLNLTKSSVLADELLVSTSTRAENLIEKVETSALQKCLYHDTYHQSSLIVRVRDGATQIVGIINSDLRIKPVPEGRRSLEGEMLHMIYQVEEIKENFHNFGNGRSGQITSRKISNMANFVAEVHVISDSVHQKEFKTTEDLIAYFAVLINGVNLSYLDMTRPRIKFMLVGITRSLDDVFSVHMEPAVLEMQKTLDGLYKYYVQGRVPGKPDIVHLITGQDLALYDKGTVDKDFAVLRNKGNCVREPAATAEWYRNRVFIVHTADTRKYISYTKPARTVKIHVATANPLINFEDKVLLGLAMTGPPCTKKAVALSEDVPTAYRGVNMMAHELGHVLGSPHDKTSRCPWSEGFLMSYEDGGTKKFRLSECSEEKIRASLKYMPHRCPKILAHTDYMSRYKYVPGQKVSELDYCRKLLKKHTSRTDIFYTKPEDLKNKCKMKCCFLTEPNIEDCLVALILDGMACGKGKTCRRGVCGQHKWPQL